MEEYQGKLDFEKKLSTILIIFEGKYRKLFNPKSKHYYIKKDQQNLFINRRISSIDIILEEVIISNVIKSLSSNSQAGSFRCALFVPHWILIG